MCDFWENKQRKVYKVLFARDKPLGTGQASQLIPRSKALYFVTFLEVTRLFNQREKENAQGITFLYCYPNIHELLGITTAFLFI